VQKTNGPEKKSKYRRARIKKKKTDQTPLETTTRKEIKY